MGAWIEILLPTNIAPTGDVAPLVGAWIEILQEFRSARRNTVAPLVGAWIEIKSEIYKVLYVSSLLSWERVLKFFSCSHCSGVMCRSSRGSVY